MTNIHNVMMITSHINAVLKLAYIIHTDCTSVRGQLLPSMLTLLCVCKKMDQSRTQTHVLKRGKPRYCQVIHHHFFSTSPPFHS